MIPTDISLVDIITPLVLAIPLSLVGTFLLGARSPTRSPLTEQIRTVLALIRKTTQSGPEFSYGHTPTPHSPFDATDPTNLTQELISESEVLCSRFRLLTDNIAASIVIRSLQDDLLLVSPYTEVLTGYSLEAFHEEGAGLLDSLVYEDDQDRYARWKRYNELGEEYRVDYRIRHRHGFPLWLESRMVPLFGPDQTITGSMILSVDITKLRTRQQVIEEQAQDLRDFTSMVSHDLKAPLFTIKGMSQVIREDHLATLPSEVAQCLYYIDEATSRLSALIGSVLEYAQVSTKPVAQESVNLDTVLTQVSTDLHEYVRTTGGHIFVEPGLPMVLGEEIRLYQVFSNLVANAFKYRSPDRPPLIKIGVTKLDSHMVTVMVSDNGMGIPERDLSAIFRPFHRLNQGDTEGERVEGSGIGLACVKKIVERLGGEVRVESKEGKGSNFFLTLPRAHKTLHEPQHTPAPAPPH